MRAPAPHPTSADEIIRALQLEPLPHEGGWFRRSYTSAVTLPDGRAAGTAIYFLLTPDGFSALHRLETEELWLFHAGDPAEHLTLDPAMAAPVDAVRVTTLGNDLAAGQVPQLIVPAGCWQGARLAPGGAWALFTCTMSPGWDEREFTLGERAALAAAFPSAVQTIHRLTR